jgi:Flp pilus assembly protein TadG
MRVRLSSRPASLPRHARSGAVALELLLAVPVTVIMILAVIEFSLVFVAAKQVALASRLGAKAAAETANVTTFVTGGGLRAAVDRHLLAAGSPGACRVMAEFGSGNVFTTVTNNGAIPCNCAAPNTPGPATATFVRVTVCARLTDFTPDLLGLYGFSIANRALTHSTTFRREL